MRLLFLVIFLSTSIISAQSFAQDYKKVGSSDLSEILQSNKGQNQVLFVYASWCPHCQVVFPELMDIERRYPNSVHAISMDSDMRRLSLFLDKTADLPIEPLVWNKDFHMGMSLGKLGVNFSGAVPFVALIDGNGEVVQQGHVTIDEVKRFFK